MATLSIFDQRGRSWLTIGRLLFLVFSSIALAVSNSINEDGSIGSIANICIKFAIFLVMLAAVFFGLSHFISSSSRIEDERKPASGLASLALKVFHGNRGFIRVFAILLVAWAPYVIALCPGVISFDLSFQLAQYYGNPMAGVFPMEAGTVLSDHHPILTTWLFGAIVDLGHRVTGSYEAGLMLLSLLVVLLTIAAFTMVFSSLNRMGVSPVVLFGALALVALLPLFPFMAMSPTKDTLFTPLFLIYLCQLMSCIGKRGEESFSWKACAVLTVLVLLMSLTKKTGGYIAIVTGIMLLLVCRKRRLVLFSAHLIPSVLALFVLPALVFPAFNISAGSKIEVLAPLFQQTARYVAEYPDDVTDEEREVIDGMLGYDTLAERYNHRLADHVIHEWDSVNLWPTLSEIIEYLGVWASQGLRHPDAYIEAFISQESGWLDVAQRFTFTQGSGTLLVEPPNGVPSIQQPVFFQRLSQYAVYCALWLEQLPGLNLFFVPALYILMPIGLFAFSDNQLRRQAVPLFIPFAISLLFLYISPTSMVSTNFEAQRYCLPLVYSGLFLAVSISRREHRAFRAFRIGAHARSVSPLRRVRSAGLPTPRAPGRSAAS